MLRVFFALQPASAQSVALVAAVAPWVAELGGLPVPAANLHATLCFVGALAEENLERLRAAAARVRGRTAELEFNAFDFWEKPGILCVTAEESASAKDLSVALGDAVSTAGFSPDLKPFRAHLTLARKVRHGVANKHAWPRALDQPMRVRCENFVLMESRRVDEKSIYSVVDSWALYADESR
jgi:2'-5' RNA ligase